MEAALAWLLPRHVKQRQFYSPQKLPGCHYPLAALRRCLKILELTLVGINIAININISWNTGVLLIAFLAAFAICFPAAHSETSDQKLFSKDIFKLTVY